MGMSENSTKVLGLTAYTFLYQSFFQPMVATSLLSAFVGYTIMGWIWAGPIENHFYKKNSDYSKGPESSRTFLRGAKLGVYEFIMDVIFTPMLRSMENENGSFGIMNIVFLYGIQWLWVNPLKGGDIIALANDDLLNSS